MSNDQRTDRPQSPTRRSTLQALGTLLATGGVAGAVTAQQAEGSYRITQGGETVAVEPLSGDLPVEELYSYRLPDQYEGVGVHDVDGGPYFESVGTQTLQRESTTITFLYDGPNGLSLVAVHGKSTTEGSGGAATWELDVRAENASWLVKDDLYWDRETGERAPTNYDNWNTDGDQHRIDWTWSGTATDGGVLGYLGDASALVIDPSYNETATLYGDHYTGKVTDWQFLSGDARDPDRFSLALDEPVAITGPESDVQPVDSGGSELTEEGGGETATEEAEQTEQTETEDESDATETEEPDETEDETGDEDERETEEEEEETEDEEEDETEDGDEAEGEISVEVEAEGDGEGEVEVEIQGKEEVPGKARGLGNGKSKGKGHERGRGKGHEKGRGNGHGD